MAEGDISGYDNNKGLAQTAFTAVANVLGLNTPTPVVAAAVPGSDPATPAAATRDTPATPGRATGDRPAADERNNVDPAATAAQLFDQQRRMSMMGGGGGGDGLGNGGSGKAQVFGPAAPGKQQPAPSAPGPRGR